MLVPETGFVASLAWFLGFRSRRADDLMRQGKASRGLIAHPIDAAPTPKRVPSEVRSIPNLPPREMAQLHARRLFEAMLDVEQYEPGEAIDSGEMYLDYTVMCEELGWRIRPWNPVAAALTKMLGGKTYREIDNSKRKHNRRPRVYIVPPLDSALRRPKPAKKPRASKPKRLPADATPAANRLRRAA
jgi:hypothetical protein